MKKIFTTYRYRAALFLLIGVAVYASVSLAVKMIRLWPDIRQGDAVSACEKRMLPLRDALPKTGVVGYITTVDNDEIFGREKTFEDVEVLAHYILAEYTLAPIIVRNSPDYPLVIGNFVEGRPDPGVIRSRHLVPIKDYGDGLILYRKEGK
jgi:hypothetical protein